MSREILPQGSRKAAPDLSKKQGRSQRDVNDYQMPTGPLSLGNRKVGLGGDVFMCGSQGPQDYDCETSGKPGLGGDRPKQGVNKRRA